MMPFNVFLIVFYVEIRSHCRRSYRHTSSKRGKGVWANSRGLEEIWLSIYCGDKLPTKNRSKLYLVAVVWKVAVNTWLRITVTTWNFESCSCRIPGEGAKGRRPSWAQRLKGMSPSFIQRVIIQTLYYSRPQNNFRSIWNTIQFFLSYLVVFSVIYLTISVFFSGYFT